MVISENNGFFGVGKVSVLALSSRFDGPMMSIPTMKTTRCFSTRSVESF